MHAQVVVLLDGKAVTGFSFEDSVFKTTCASSPTWSGARQHLAFIVTVYLEILIMTHSPGWQAAAQGIKLHALSMGHKSHVPNKPACER